MSPERDAHLWQMEWSFRVERGGLVWPDPGSNSPQLKSALEDCVESLSPNGEDARLSTYWIDHALQVLLAPTQPDDAVIASGNAWSLIRSGDQVRVHFDYGDEADVGEVVSVAELVAALTKYRAVVVSAIESGHELDRRRWAQRNPYRQ